MTRLQLTVHVEYHVHDAAVDYKTTDPDEIAELDEQYFRQNPEAIVDIVKMEASRDDGCVMISVDAV